MPKKVLIEGDVVLRDGSRLDLEPFEAEFILSDEAFKESRDHIGTARIIVKKGLIKEYLRKKYKNFKNCRNVQVVELKDTEEKAETSELENLLIKATKLDCIPENIENYRRKDHKAKALERAIESAEKRAKNKKKKKDNVEDLGYVD